MYFSHRSFQMLIAVKRGTSFAEAEDAATSKFNTTNMIVLKTAVRADCAGPRG